VKPSYSDVARYSKCSNGSISLKEFLGETNSTCKAKSNDRCAYYSDA